MLVSFNGQHGSNWKIKKVISSVILIIITQEKYSMNKNIV